MNLTEAWESVLKAAEAVADEDLLNSKELHKACRMVRPRVERMRGRLEALRARRAGRPLCPRGLEP